MSKLDSKTLNTIERVLTERSEARFQPSDDMRKAKSAFWGALTADSVVTPGDEPNLSLAIRYAGDPKIRTWWVTPGFQEWFWNKSEFDQRLEYLAQIALDELEQTLKSRMVTPTQKIPAIKLALEVSSKLRIGPDSSSLPDKIESMTKAELEAFIQSRQSLVLTSGKEDDTVPESK